MSLFKHALTWLVGILFTTSALASQFAVTSINEEAWQNTRAISIRLTDNVDPNSNWRRQLSVYQAGDKLDNDLWVLDERRILLPFVEPDTLYAVEVDKNLQSESGDTLADDSYQELTTLALSPYARFRSSGSVLTPELKMALPVDSLNTEEVDIEVFHLGVEEAAKWQNLLGQDKLYYGSLNQISQQHDMVFSGRFALKHSQNASQTTNLDFSDIDDLQQPGVYLATLRVPGNYQYSYDAMIFSVSDIGLQLRRNGEHWRIYSHSISTGEPLNQVRIRFFEQEKVVGNTRSDRWGEAELRINNNDYPGLVMAELDDQLTLLPIYQSMLDLSQFANAQNNHTPQQLFAWAERDLFRPGERLQVHALLRDYDSRYVGDVPIKAVLTDAMGSEVSTQVLNEQTSGQYTFDYAIGSNAATGDWRLTFYHSATNEFLQQHIVQVEEFLPERIALTLLNGQTSQLSHNTDSVDLPVQADFLYGAPAAGNRIDGNLQAELDHRPFSQWQDFYFGDVDEVVPASRQQLPSAQLDSNGQHSYNVSLAPWQQVKSPLAIIANVSVYESGGRSVDRRGVLSNIKPGTYVGLNPQFDDAPKNDSNTNWQAIVTDETGALISAEGVELRLIKEERDYFWRQTDSEGWVWDYRENEIVTDIQVLDFSGDAPVNLTLPVEYGDYRVELYVAGELNNRFRFRTNWGGWWRQNDAMQPDQIQVTWQQGTVAPGDTMLATLTPASSGMARVTVESSEAVLWQQDIELSANGTSIEIPINRRWDRHDLYLTALQIIPGDMQHSVAPKRAIGIAHLPVERDDARIALSLEVPERVEPNQTVTAKVQGNISEGYVWVAAVDVGVLNITRFATPQPDDFLLAPKRYNWLYYDIYDQIIDNAGFDYSQQRWGGGFARAMMAEADFVRGGDKPNSDVQIVALQKAPVAFDENGQAQVELDIPQFNGKLRWMAVAWNNQATGSTDAETTVAEKVVTQLSKPRFLAVGDETKLALDLHNLSGASQALTVRFNIGSAAPVNTSQTITLADKEKRTLVFPLTAERLADIPLSLQVSNGDDINIDRTWQIGVRAPAPQATRQVRQIIEANSSWQVDFQYDDWLDDSIRAQLTLSSQPPVDVLGHFDYLLRYPYGCTEQTISGAWPWLMLDQTTVERFDLRARIEEQFDQPYTNALRREQLEHAIERVLGRQLASGGFSLWSGSSMEDYWVSVYTTDFLVSAQQAGVPVNQAKLEQALNRLQQYLSGQVAINRPWSDDSYSYQFATQAYSAYVLANSGANPLAQLRRMLKASDFEQVQSPLAWMHAGSAAMQAGDSRLASELQQQALSTQRNERDYIGDYGSPVRDLALVNRFAANNDQLDNTSLLALFEALQNKQWLSTQERIALLQLAVALDLDNQGFTATINSTLGDMTLNEDSRWQRGLTSEGLQSLTAISAGDQRLFVTLTAAGQSKAPLAAVQNGFAIRRDYFDLIGQPLELSSLASGELIITRLQVHADQDSGDALVVDLLPAGLEIENPNISAISYDTLTVDGNSIASWQGNVAHSEYRDDRFVAALSLRAGESQYLYYVARAVSPGEYQVPAPYVEDMYRPNLHANGTSIGTLTITEQ
ncbi:alpha-2-macroglobulin family protein [Salinibius halmophilus]|uniref:alpha-2-macroglobulin family protein n=1 Tax=Salinibius halmophilus TaxID=1853216 RepID=UPI000E66D6CD|nr:alpha-2-macroglobulin [Salinibius halmophilus]